MASFFVTVIFQLTGLENQTSFDKHTSNNGNKWNMFKNRRLHFIN